jgi:hypothetical protein
MSAAEKKNIKTFVINKNDYFCGSSRRKNEWPAAEQMNMKVKNRLPAVRICVDHDAIAVLGYAPFTSDLGRRELEMAERRLLSDGRRIERIEMLARNNENMRRSLRAYVVERDAGPVLVNLVGRNLARNYLAKQTIILHIRMIY